MVKFIIPTNCSISKLRVRSLTESRVANVQHTLQFERMEIKDRQLRTCEEDTNDNMRKRQGALEKYIDANQMKVLRLLTGLYKRSG